MAKTISSSSDDKWRVESDLRTLMDAEEVKKDPKRMKAVQALAKEKAEEMTKVRMELDEKK